MSASQLRPSSPPPEPAYVNGFVDGPDLVLLYRDARGQLLGRRKKAEWSSFYRRDAWERLSPDVLRDIRSSEYVFGVSVEGDWVRVKWKSAEWREAVRGPDRWEDKNGLVSYEADVDPVRRFFSESGAEVAKPRRVYLDIETDSRVQPVEARNGRARVLCYALVDEAGATVDARLLAEDSDAAEKELLAALWAALDPFDQVVAWYGDGFDFPCVRRRSEILGVRHKPIERWLWMDFLPVYERMNRNASGSGAEKESMALQSVAMSRLGYGKADFDSRSTWEAYAAGPEKRAELLAYCLQDVRLLPALNAKTGFLDVNDAICSVCRLFANTESGNPTIYVDGFLLRMGVERRTRFATRERYSKEDEENREKFKGAFVMEPKIEGTGVEADIHVADFSAMYPSIIMTFNMSPETKVSVNVSGAIGRADACRSPATRQGFLVGASGILPDALKRVRQMRKFWQDKEAKLAPGTPEWEEAHRLSTAYKVIANSFYGVVGSPFSRFFDRAIAESVTQTGVWLIRRTIDEAERRGMECVYTDTDSLFVRGVERKAFADFVAWCNRELYPPLLVDAGCRENFVEIAYEKEFARLVMVSAKKYCAVYRHYKWVTSCSCDVEKDGKKSPGALDVRTMTCRDCGKTHAELPPARGKPEIRGLEYKRGDAVRLARSLQEKAINLLMVEKCDDPAAYEPIVEAAKKHVLEEPLPVEEVRQSKTLSKPLKDYQAKKKANGEDAALPPHVQVAKVLKARGEQVGKDVRVEYYVVDASDSPMKVAPAADYDGAPDRYYLWEDLVWPATERLLAAAFPARPGMSNAELVARDWRRHSKVRPRAARARKAQPPAQDGAPARRGKATAPEQGGLFDARPAPAGGPRGPLVVELDGRRPGPPDLGAVKAALDRHPGDRAVELRIATADGVAVLDVPQRVAESPELLRELAAATKPA